MDVDKFKAEFKSLRRKASNFDEFCNELGLYLKATKIAEEEDEYTIPAGEEEIPEELIKPDISDEKAYTKYIFGIAELEDKLSVWGAKNGISDAKALEELTEIIREDTIMKTDPSWD